MLGLHHLGGGWGWGCFSGGKLLGFFFFPPEERGDLEAGLHLYNYITTHKQDYLVLCSGKQGRNRLGAHVGTGFFSPLHDGF